MDSRLGIIFLFERDLFPRPVSSWGSCQPLTFGLDQASGPCLTLLETADRRVCKTLLSRPGLDHPHLVAQ
jgi:hypothetical protein